MFLENVVDTTTGNFYNGDGTSAPGGSLADRAEIKKYPILTRTYIFAPVTLSAENKTTTLLLNEPRSLLFAIGHTITLGDGKITPFSGTLAIANEHTVTYTSVKELRAVKLLVTIGWTYV